MGGGSHTPHPLQTNRAHKENEMFYTQAHRGHKTPNSGLHPRAVVVLRRSGEIGP